VCAVAIEEVFAELPGERPVRFSLGLAALIDIAPGARIVRKEIDFLAHVLAHGLWM
jgi:hypothetical protein